MRYYRNPPIPMGLEGSYTNPRRRHHHNPLPLKEWLSVEGAMKGLSVAGGFVFSDTIVTALSGGSTAVFGPTGLPIAGAGFKLGYTAPRGADGKVANPDLMAAAIDALAHIGVGLAGGWALHQAGQKEIGEGFTLGGVAAGFSKFIGNLGVLPAGVLSSGSIVIGHNLGPTPGMAAVGGATKLSQVRSGTMVSQPYSL